MPWKETVSSHLASFILAAEAVDACGDAAPASIIQLTVDAQQAIFSVAQEALRGAAQPPPGRGKRPKVDAFRGTRAAIHDISRSHPEAVQELRRGLVFAAKALSMALADEHSLVASQSGHGLFSYQLPEPCEAWETSVSKRSVTRLQCVGLLAAGFFGVISRYSEAQQEASQKDMPEFSFEVLWAFDCERWSTINFVLMGVLHYFTTVSTQDMNTLQAEQVSITRKAIGSISEASRTAVFCPLDLQKDGVSIHAFEGDQNLQADFANMYLGGAVFRGGGSQEESMCVEFTELLAIVYLAESMLPFEAIEIAGLKRYAELNLMASRHLHDRRDHFCRPASAAANVTMVAFDALCFNSYGIDKWSQYEPEHIRRELRKCLAALIPTGTGTRDFVTGLWGCGAFRGDPELKFVIQWICCSLEPSVAKMVFCPWDQYDALVNAGILDLIQKLADKVSVSKVVALLCEDPDFMQARSTFAYLLEKLASV